MPFMRGAEEDSPDVVGSPQAGGAPRAGGRHSVGNSNPLARLSQGQRLAGRPAGRPSGAVGGRSGPPGQTGQEGSGAEAPPALDPFLRTSCGNVRCAARTRGLPAVACAQRGAFTRETGPEAAPPGRTSAAGGPP
jgi:translation initiation factor IF-2